MPVNLELFPQSITTVVLIDDHLLFRLGLKTLFNRSHKIKVVGETGEGRQGLQLIDQFRPDVIVLDISMADDTSGLNLVPRIREIAPNSEILILTMHNNQNYIYRALKTGCRGYMLKADSPTELVEAIEAVSRKQTYLSPSVNNNFIDRLVGKTKAGKTSSLLTKREQEIADLAVLGQVTRQIAVNLLISSQTVRVHLANIRKKFSCKSRSELILRLQETKTH